MSFFKRWKVTTRTRRGVYSSRFFATRRSAKVFADGYTDQGLGVAKVTKDSR